MIKLAVSGQREEVDNDTGRVEPQGALYRSLEQVRKQVFARCPFAPVDVGDIRSEHQRWLDRHVATLKHRCLTRRKLNRIGLGFDQHIHTRSISSMPVRKVDSPKKP